jgi:DNA-binding MarR family transcriptional regulator
MEDPRAVAAEIGRLYPAVFRRFHVSKQPVAGIGVTPRMLSVLQHLVAAGPMTLGELAQHLGLSRATATELVTRVEQRGLVARIRDERDRRRVFVWVTQEGQQRARARPRVLADEALVAAVSRMTPVERDQLVQGLRALLAAADHPDMADTSTDDTKESKP